MKQLLKASILLLIVNNLYMRYIIKIINIHPGDEFWFVLITCLNVAYSILVLLCVGSKIKRGD